MTTSIWAPITSHAVEEVRYFSDRKHTIEVSIFYKWGRGEMRLNDEFGTIVEAVRSGRINVLEYHDDFELDVLDHSYDEEYRFPSSMCQQQVKRIRDKFEAEGFDEDVLTDEEFDYIESDYWFNQPRLDLTGLPECVGAEEPA